MRVRVRAPKAEPRMQDCTSLALVKCSEHENTHLCPQSKNSSSRAHNDLGSGSAGLVAQEERKLSATEKEVLGTKMGERMGWLTMG